MFVTVEQNIIEQKLITEHNQKQNKIQLDRTELNIAEPNKLE